MSLNRDQNVTSNTSSSLDIPLKKRKGLRFHASLPPSDGYNTKKMKKRTEDISYPKPVKKKNYESSSVCVDADTEDNVNNIHINPYFSHVRNNVTSHEGETCHNIVSLVQKGSGHLSGSDLNTADHNQEAQADFSSPHKYFPIPDELCGIASGNGKPPCALDLTKNPSVHEHLEKSQKRASNMQFRSVERGHSLVSSLTQKRGCTLRVSDLKDKGARATHSSMPSKYFKVLPESSDGFTRNKVVYESSDISSERTSGTQIKSEPTSSSSVLWEDRCLFHNNSHSLKGCSSPSTLVEIYENSCLPTPIFDKVVIPQFKNGFIPSLKMCENKPHPSSKVGIEPKLPENHSHALALSLREHAGSEFAIQTGSPKSLQLPKSEPYSIYKFNINSKLAQPKSGSTSSAKFTEHDISPVIRRNAYAKTESLPSSFSQQSDYSEFPKDNGKQGGSEFFLKNKKMNYINSCSSKKAQEMLVPKSKLCRVTRDLVQITGRPPHYETDRVSKQESYCNSKKSKGNCKKQTGEQKFIAGHRYQGEVMNTKEEESSVEKKEFQHKENSYVLGVSCYKSGIVPVAGKEIQNAMNHHRIVNQDINKDSKKYSEGEATVCIDDIHTLHDEENNHRNSDYEESVLVIGDDDGISVLDISDGSEDTDDDDDDVEIVHCVSKSNVGMRNVSVRRKEVNSVNSSTRNSDFKAAAQNIVSHPSAAQNIVSHPYHLSKVLKLSKSSLKSDACAIPDNEGMLIDELRGEVQRPYRKSVWEPYYRTSNARNDIVTNGVRFQATTSTRPVCLETQHQTLTPTPQVLPSGIYDVSHNTEIQSMGSPPSLPSVQNSFELLFHSFKFQLEKSQTVPSQKYPSSSDAVPVVSSGDARGSYTLPDKKQGCDRNLVSIVDGHEENCSNSAIASSITNNTVATSPESISDVCCNAQEMSFEPDNEDILVPLEVIPKLTSVHDTALETLEVSCNLQEGKNTLQKEEISTGVSNSHGEKKQKVIAKDDTETTQKGPRHEWECAICLEAISSKQGISATVCGHVYCTPCITEVVCKRKECPTCRKALDSAQVHPLYMFG
jgi:hypothetical protein